MKLKEKEGEMKINWGVTLIVVLAVVIIAAVAINSYKPTGQATSTFTSGANYGAITPGFNTQTQCTYVDENDGWDVTKKTTVRFYERTSGKYIEYADACVSQETVSENECEDGYRKTRLVNCPSETSCIDGACVVR